MSLAAIERRIKKIEGLLPPQPDMVLATVILEEAARRDPQVVCRDGQIDMTRLTDDELERLFRACGGRE